MKTDVEIYKALAIAQGLEFYAKHKMRINRAYTPTNMIRMAIKITGNKYKPREYKKASDGLKDWITS